MRYAVQLRNEGKYSHQIKAEALGRVKIGIMGLVFSQSRNFVTSKNIDCVLNYMH